MNREEALKELMDSGITYNVSEICNHQAEDFHKMIDKIYDGIDKEFESLFNAIKYTQDKELIVTLIKQMQKVLK